MGRLGGTPRVLNFARRTKTRVIYASSASTYGAVTQASVESNGAAPANAYSFSKAIMDNIASRAAVESPDWIIIGLRYFNVYGPHEAHKGIPASTKSTGSSVASSAAV